YDIHIRGILFDDREVAERVRLDLQRGRMTWKDAVARYSIDPNKRPDGDLGWVKRYTLKGDFAIKVFSVRPGAVSELVQDVEGYHLFQVVERRLKAPPPLGALRMMIVSDIKTMKSTPVLERFIQTIAKNTSVTFDSTNIRWAAARFREAAPPPRSPNTIDL